MRSLALIRWTKHLSGTCAFLRGGRWGTPSRVEALERRFAVQLGQVGVPAHAFAECASNSDFYAGLVQDQFMTISCR